jgi:hypothetical protein
MRRFIQDLDELRANILAFQALLTDDPDLFVELLRRGRAFLYDARTGAFANSKGIAFFMLTAIRYRRWREIREPGAPPFQGTPARLRIEALVGRPFRPDAGLSTAFARWCEEKVPGCLVGVDSSKWLFLRLEDEPFDEIESADGAAPDGPTAESWAHYAESWDAYAVWEPYNAVLYRMFADWPRHDRLDRLVAKVGLLSRAYAAGLERHGTPDGRGAIHDVAAALLAHGAEVDALFDGVRLLCASERTLSLALLHRLIEVHGRMVEIVGAALRDEHRVPSFVSKYCHFEVDWFPIYDSRARATLEAWYPRYGGRNQHIDAVVGADERYLAFCNRFHSLWADTVAAGLPATVRRLDQYLLYCCDNKLWDG